MLNIELNNGNIGYFGLLIVPTEMSQFVVRIGAVSAFFQWLHWVTIFLSKLPIVILNWNYEAILVGLISLIIPFGAQIQILETGLAINKTHLWQSDNYVDGVDRIEGLGISPMA